MDETTLFAKTKDNASEKLFSCYYRIKFREGLIGGSTAVVGDTACESRVGSSAQRFIEDFRKEPYIKFLFTHHL